ncbi:5'-adenylylsulfate reductase-like 5 isoform X2 [Magnolia sinica]|uniref:5'-adenylylsulfate reductase-like 5 isoform X2 n=1 Tax=Magnolia sinica TaxID=86752 RepID=UPI002659AC4B|nr:5'-adenylylsulfate reductase-like 5 isoform X2 [Magnolia sinica]
MVAFQLVGKKMKRIIIYTTWLLPMVDGESLDRALTTSDQRSAYTSVLFYASWCPFSRSARSTFDVLSSMFPQITHLVVEESSVMPVVFSRYGVHSLPAILIANRTLRMRHYGSKDLSSLILFYKRVTGLEPMEYFKDDQSGSLGSQKSLHLWDGSPREILRREPYLVFSLLFVCLKALLYFFPGMLSRIIAVWVSYGWHPNLGIFGETSQLLERVLHVVNMKRAWSKLRLCKTGNFQNGAKNARVWASSLASVSLGESSSTRTAPLDS